MVSPVLTSKYVRHEEVYRHFVEKVESGRFKSTHANMQVLADRVLNKRLGCPVAMSYSGIGGDITNGFVQFIVDDPVQFHDLNIFLVELIDHFDKPSDRPCINIRSKSLPAHLVTDIDKQFITVMFRSPKFKNRKHADDWWATLAGYVQSYS